MAGGRANGRAAKQQKRSGNDDGPQAQLVVPLTKIIAANAVQPKWLNFGQPSCRR
jgi:hypothetical protein